MNQIIPNLFLGDIRDATAPDLHLSIDRAIAICTEYTCHHACPDSWNVPFDDGYTVDVKIIHRVVSLIHEGMENGQRVLIHCAAGISRSPMIVACYLVKTGKFTNFDTAIEFVQSQRKIVDPAGPILRSGRAYCLTGIKLEKRPNTGIIVP